jgi:molybdate transport system substrate-binding protein
VLTLALAGVVAGMLSGCGSDGAGSDRRTLEVLAAASLTETFTALAERFEDDHPDVTVRLVFDSSATLAEQVKQGAPADVLATADERTMQVVVDAGSTEGEPALFASNRLVLVTPAGDAAGVTSVTDLDDPQVTYVVCVPAAPCGTVARTVLDAAGVSAPAASEEVDVKAVLAKVTLDEADAGLVYATDAMAAGDAVATVEIPAAEDAVTRYPVAALTEADDPDLADGWVDLVMSEEGRQVLREAGFGAP